MLPASTSYEEPPLLPLAAFRRSRLLRLSGVPRPEAEIGEIPVPKTPNIFFHKKRLPSLESPRSQQQQQQAYLTASSNGVPYLFHQPQPPQRPPFTPCNPHQARREFTSFVPPLISQEEKRAEEIRIKQERIRHAQVRPFVPANPAAAKQQLKSRVFSLECRDDRDMGYAYAWERLSSRQRTKLGLNEIGTPLASKEAQRRASGLATAVLQYEIALAEAAGSMTAR